MWLLPDLPPKVLLPEARLADGPMHTVFCCLSTVEIHTEFGVIESEAKSVGTEIGTAVRVISAPYCPRMCERQDGHCDITLGRFCVTTVAVEKQ